MAWSVSPGIAGSVTISGPLTATFQAGTSRGKYPAALRATAFGVTGTADVTVVPGALDDDQHTTVRADAVGDRERGVHGDGV